MGRLTTGRSSRLPISVFLSSRPLVAKNASSVSRLAIRGAVIGTVGWMRTSKSRVETSTKARMRRRMASMSR